MRIFSGWKFESRPQEEAIKAGTRTSETSVLGCSTPKAEFGVHHPTGAECSTLGCGSRTERSSGLHGATTKRSSGSCSSNQCSWECSVRSGTCFSSIGLVKFGAYSLQFYFCTSVPIGNVCKRYGKEYLWELWSVTESKNILHIFTRNLCHFMNCFEFTLYLLNISACSIL